MGEFFSQLDGLEKLYFIAAIIGGALFVVRLILSFIGGDTDVDVDGEFDFDVDHGGFDPSFKILSLQGLTGFFMMFGLVGLAMSKSGFGAFFSIPAAVAAGLLMVWVITKLFQIFRQFQSSGTLDTESAIGQEGTVYLTISPKGTGKVQVTFKGRLREYDAVSENKQELTTGERVIVDRVIRGNILSVSKMSVDEI